MSSLTSPQGVSNAIVFRSVGSNEAIEMASTSLDETVEREERVGEWPRDLEDFVGEECD